MINRIRKITVRIFILLILVVIGSNLWIVLSTYSESYTNIEDFSPREIALVLGTSNKLVSGEENPFFKDRIKTAIDLYNGGKIKYILVSGDNRSKYYNEPVMMQQALIEKGIPENVITLDYAGLRTLDSIIRCKEIFGQDSIVIVTQKFHSYRALFLSNHYGISAVAVDTGSLPLSVSIKTIIREFLARPKALWDTYITHQQPRHLGDKEIINKGV